MVLYKYVFFLSRDISRRFGSIDELTCSFEASLDYDVDFYITYKCMYVCVAGVHRYMHV